MDMLRRMITNASVGITVAIAVASSVAATSSAAGVQAGAANKLSACSLLTIDEIDKATGKESPAFVRTMKPEEHAAGRAGSECEMAGYTIQLDAYPAAQFEETRKSFMVGGRTTFQPLADAGDTAYTYDQGAGSSVHVVGAFVKVGQHVLTISNIVGMQETPESVRADVVAVAKAAAAKLK